MKKIFSFLAMVLMVCNTSNAKNEHAVQIEYPTGKYLYFTLNETDHIASVTWNGKYQGAETEDYKGDIQIPETITKEGVEYKVKAISDYAFCNCTELRSITFPKEFVVINSDAFKGCTGLSAVLFPEKLERIGMSAFEGCTNLTSISLPEELGTIGTDAFKGCTSLTSISIPSTVTRIDDMAFDQIALQEVYVYSDNLTSVGTRAWSTTIPTYVPANSFMKYKNGLLKNYNVKVLPDDNIGELLKPYLNLSDEETEIYNELLKIRGTMGKKQAGPAIEVTDQNDKVIRLYNPKKVNFIKVPTEE